MVKIDLEKTYTVEEYLALEAQSELRHEFFYGNLYELPGNTIFIERMVKSLFKILNSKVSESEFEIFTKNIKIQMPDRDAFFYPDLVLVPQKEQVGTSFFGINPILILELQSDSTRYFNFIDKFIQYRKLDSLQYYLLVEPEKQVVFFYEKAADGDWVAKTYTENDEEVKLPLLNATLRIGDIYGN
jgi:Uma2 family endonuclease